MKNEQVEYALSLLADISQALTRLAECSEREEAARVAAGKPWQPGGNDAEE